METMRFAPHAADGFFIAVKQRVAAYLKASGKTRYADGWVHFKAILFAATAVGAYLLVVTHALPNVWLLPAGFVFGIATLLLAINIGHDAAHRVLFRGRFWNEAALVASFVPLGVNPYLWRLRHTRSHHVFPNVNGCDIDVDENPLLRLSPNQPWKRHFRFQHWYAPLAYVAVVLHTVLWQDVVYLFKKELANLRDIRHPRREYALFLVWKALYFAIVIVLPVYCLPMPWWKVVGGYLLMQAAVSLAFVLMLIGTHFCDMTEFPSPGVDGSLGQSWAMHNLATACDWSPHSRTAHFLAGGVNAHASHHLFPNVSHAHYRAIARIVEDAASEFGVPYHRLSLGGMVRSHFRFLRAMGREPATA
jgi:linoleoyl-CoA desaturase